MTVCTTRMFLWNYGTNEQPDWGPAFIAATDRMLTAGAIEYEGSRWKGLTVGKNHMVFVAGEMPFNSEAISRMNFRLSGLQNADGLQIAEALAISFSEVQRKRAARTHLAPLNLDESVFHPGSPHTDLVDKLARKMADEVFDVEAMVVGVDDVGTGLFHIDNRGVATFHADVGFLSIGLGCDQANGQYMSETISHSDTYIPALYSTFRAKKRAETVSGVGDKKTDMFLITRNAVDQVPDELVAELGRIHDRQIAADKKVTAKSLTAYTEFEKAFFAKRKAAQTSLVADNSTGSK